MALTKIDDVHLYTGVTDGAAEGAAIKKWLVANNIKYQLLFYGDDSVHKQVLEALSSWWQGDPNSVFEDFPVLTYTEIHDDLPPSRYPKKYFKTLEAIETSDFLATYKSTNSNPTA
jgi:hypothetical protein